VYLCCNFANIDEGKDLVRVKGTMDLMVKNVEENCCIHICLG